MISNKLDNTEKVNPRANANFLSALTFWWTLKIFLRGYKNDIEVEDLTESLKEHKSELLGDKLSFKWENEKILAEKQNRKPRFQRALIKMFGASFMLYGVVLFFEEAVIRMLQPFALGKLIDYFSPNNTTITETDAYFYGLGVVLCSLISIFFIHPYMMAILHIGMKIRVACCSLVYRKSLKLNKTALGSDSTVGQVVNLLSNDVNRFDIAIIFLHYLWIGPIQTIIATYFMYKKIGPSTFFGVAFMLCFIPLQGWLGKKTASLRLKTAIRTDERVRLMNEIISGIQVIKMYTWEKSFVKLVSTARKNEVSVIRATSYIRGIILSFITFISRTSIFVSILMHYLMHYSMGLPISATQVFVMASYYNILRQTMTVFFPQGLAQIGEVLVSIKRLEKFLFYEEMHIPVATKVGLTHNNSYNMGSKLIPPTTTSISIRNATAKWIPKSKENSLILNNISLSLVPSRLMAVIGPVGSGKSSLLHAILGELPLISGKIEVNGTISYASQEPWLFPGSVRQNIIFGQKYEKERYKQVIKCCSLERDFRLFPFGDRTIVGDRGVSLSGGQKARINLARAIYKKADIYLLDDPLSAVDTHVGEELFQKCINGSLLKDKIRILVTHQLQYLHNIEQIVILNNGCVDAEGDYKHLVESGLDFAKLLETNHVDNDVDDELKKHEQLDLSNKSLHSRHGSIQSIISIEDLVNHTSLITDDASDEYKEHKATGTVSSKVYKDYFKAGGSWLFVFYMLLLFFLAQLAASGGDYFITFWVNLEEEKQIQGVDFEDSFWNLSSQTCIYIYTVISVLTIVISLWRSFTFFQLCMKASINLHDQMFRSICTTTMRFFNTNNTGRILNRFSKDMGAVDEILPAALIDCIQIGLQLIGIIIVVGVVNYLLMLPTFLIGVVFYLLRCFYLPTSRSVKRLEGITRSPVFSHLSSSLQGLTTIRAFQAQKILEFEFDQHQNLHSSAWYLFIASSRAFGFWLDLICIIYIAIVTLSFLVLDQKTFGANVGLAITQAIGLTGMFQWGMRQSAELENQMTSVERVMEYNNLEREQIDDDSMKKPDPLWPLDGKLEFQNVFLKYGPNEPFVLKNLCFEIQSKEKVGIVGRTGAGKSSLITALFQLAKTQGRIIIDGIDIAEINLHNLRSKISIIPQEPVLFSGTLRKNLDPFDEYPDYILWKAIEDVELKEVIHDLAAGLNSKMSEGGSNFSVGQRQLVCLARAILRNNKILVLDEATANVDPQTDSLIQTTIRKKFSDCTVLTIAHRLHTVMDSDKILVMDAGSAVEFDHPAILLQNGNGYLFKMVQKTGRAMSDVLSKIAVQSFEKKQHLKRE